MKTRTLVVYFSRTGTTRRVADEIALALDADVDVIVERRSRKGIMGYMRSAYEATRKQTVDIAHAARLPANYDLVIIGTPTWNAAVSSPVRSYLERYASSMHDVALFCTCGGRGGERVIDQMTELTKHPRATLVVREGDVQSGVASTAIEQFVARLKPSVTRAAA